MGIHEKVKPLTTGDIVELEIFDLNQHGQGVGRYKNLIVFVDETLPGETAKVEIETVKKKYATGVMRELIVPADTRTKPLCPLAGRCGGCAVQHMKYNAQLKWKQEHIAGLFDRASIKGWNREKMLPIIGMTEPWHYRAKVQIPFAGSSDKPLAGFFARRSHQIVDGDVCLIQHPVADIVRSTIRNYIRSNNLDPYNEKTHTGTIRHVIVRTGFFSGQVMVVIVTKSEDLPNLDDLTRKLIFEINSWIPAVDDQSANQTSSLLPDHYELSSLWLNLNEKRSNVVMGDRLRLIFGQKYLKEEILGIQYRISPRAFFQVNPYQTVKLYEEVINMSNLKGSETVLDLYCGTGSISLLLAQKAAHVTGVEVVADAIADAWLNVKENGLGNVDFVTAAAEEWLPEYLSSGSQADIAVIDPPRKGCDAALIKALADSSIPIIIYVSCNPATLVRDLSALGRAYEVSNVRPVDMFPHSDSIECVVRLERINQ